MDTKQLRQKILDLAIRGKLVPQDPNDEPACVLLERVKAEKERLIAEGKIKRSKKSATSSDKPHYADWDLPSGWVWVRLDEICDIKGGKRIPRGMKLTDSVTSHIYIRVTDMKDCSVDMSELKYITDEIYDVIKNYTISANDLYITIAGSIGRVGEIPKELHNAILTENAAKLTNIICDKKFLMYALLSDIAQSHFTSRFHQVAQPKLSIETASCTLIPLPPLNEQARIVNVIDHFLAIIKDINKSTDELSSAISQVKSKILELAISGKLVPQDLADEPAADLLQRVNPNAVVSADTSHYQHMPQGWCVCKLEDIVEYEQPQRYIVESTDYSDAYKTPVLTAGKSFVIGHTNETAGVFNNVPVIIFDDFTTDSKYVDFPFKVKSSAMKILHVKHGVNIKYVYYFMSITRLVGKTHKRYWISEYSKLDIPLPPYNEQCRIVDAIEHINNRIDDIAEAL